MPQNNSRSRKEQRRKDAEQRQEVRSKRTDQEQLAHLDALGLTATKERAKLQKRIDDAAAKAAAKKAKKEPAEATAEEPKAKKAKGTKKGK